MKSGRKTRWLVAILLAWVGYVPAQASANEPALSQTVFNTDYVTAGVGYGERIGEDVVRVVGNKSIKLQGVSGPVKRAYLYWHGPTNSTQANVNASILLNGLPVTGTNIGFSSDNGWDMKNTQAYRADVTASVFGNGDYTLSGFSSSVEVNGASLIVFFNDGDPNNNRDVMIYDGNDSDTTGHPVCPNYPGELLGWNLSVAGINYTTGAASLQLHVSDGQTFYDDALILNGQLLAGVPGGSNTYFEGTTDPASNPIPNSLWDIRTFNIAPFLSPGPNTVTLTSGLSQDCLGLVAALVDLPAHTAPQAQISLLPSPDEQCFATPTTITAKVVDSDGNTVFPINVSFAVVSGPNAGQNGVGVTTPAGTASFTYTGLSAGTDTVQACITFNGTTQCASKTQQWNVCSNKAPDVHNAAPTLSCLWPPNHQFVNVGITGVTDPDGDPVTITITGITSDEPTAGIKGAGGVKKVPDAMGVGKDTAGLRAERSGMGDGRVYEMTFVADDGTGMSATGKVRVNVPQDMKGKSCPAVDGGQLYDATQ